MNTTTKVADNFAKNIVSTKNLVRNTISSMGNMPEKKFRAGAVSATVWLNKGQKTDGEEAEYRTISIERSYTDKEGKWQSSNSLRINDLPRATVVLQKAYEFLVLNEQKLFNGGN
ncbi:hypothetical protein HYX12_02880 [Candidatus Woesearchaeota archaeon]|nr:hypothetical protein [Candidatus Woesearchaeota archaeon]